MARTIPCASCGAAYGVRPGTEEQRFSCQKCGAQVVVPAQSSTDGGVSLPVRKEGVGKKIGSILSIPSALGLGLLFFLPWLELSCDAGGYGTFSLGKASGLQLARGDMSEGDGWARIWQQEGQEVRKLDFTEVLKPRPLFYLGLAVPGVLLFVGFLGILGKLKTSVAGMLTMGTALAGIGVTVMAMGVDYTDEMTEAKRKEVTEEIRKQEAISPSVQERIDRQVREKRRQWVAEARQKGEITPDVETTLDGRADEYRSELMDQAGAQGQVTAEVKQKVEERMKVEKEKLSSMLKTKPTGVVYAGLALHVLVLFLGVLGLGLGAPR